MSLKLHLCCGSIYLKDYINCDHSGMDVAAINQASQTLGFKVENPNETTLDKYFKHPFEKDPTKRIRPKTIIDKAMDILKMWPFNTNSIDEIVMISAFEHFEHASELIHIISEAHRVLNPGGVWKFDFPDIVGQVKQYAEIDDEFMMELIYCNHKDKYSIHQWGYTHNTIGKHLNRKGEYWKVECKQVVKHAYPMQGVWAFKI